MESHERQVLAPFRRRTVRVGVNATLLILAGLVVVPFLPGSAVTHQGAYWTLIVLTLLGVTVVSRLPWDRLLETPAGEWLLYAWSLLDIALITGLVAVTGGARSSFVLVYALTTIFFAASYPRRGQYALFALTSMAYLVGVSLSPGGGVIVADAVVVVATLGVAAYMTSFTSRELLGQVEAHARARREADERAGLLACAAAAARTMTSLDPEEVLGAVVRAAADLGFETAYIGLFDDDGESYRVVHAHGLPRGVTDDSAQPARHGMPGLVREKRATVAMDEHHRPDRALPLLDEAGVRAAVAAPIWAQGDLAAVLVAGTGTAREVGRPEVEAFDLLAAQAGRALENVARFESELRTLEHLEELDRLKSDFVANVSHELRTPLTVVSGMSRTVTHRWEDLGEDQRRAFVDRIRESAAALEDIVGTLLDFSGLEQGRLETEHSVVDLSRLVSGVVERVRSSSPDHRVRIETRRPLPVEGDASLLQRVLENLVRNAVLHTPAGTEVLVRAVERDAEAVLEVHDDGPGIQEEVQAHLGERFFRGGDTDTRPTRGLGLGLAISTRILALHRTTLDVDSTPGEGSTFAFRLPLVGAGTGDHGPREADTGTSGRPREAAGGDAPAGSDDGAGHTERP